MLWRCIERHRREAVRTSIGLLPQTAALVVSYTAIERYMFKDLFMKLTVHHIALNKRIDKGKRLFSEVSDPQLSRMLLARELFECLQVPDNDARTLALANIDLLQAAATQAKNSLLGSASHRPLSANTISVCYAAIWSAFLHWKPSSGRTCLTWSPLLAKP